MKISIRQTQKGDWLVFEAIPATLGVGVDQVDSPAGGYTTGLQFQRFETDEEAENYAGALVAKTNAELVEWQPPQRQNSHFEDLPQLYPDRANYETKEQAEAAGWIRINPSKTITHYRGIKIYCADVTPGNSFGYELSIKALDQEFAHSAQIGIGRYFSIRFRAGDILDAIESVRKFIDHDLITQAEAVKEGAPSVQAVNNAIREGYLTGYRDPGSNPHRPGGQLVSRTEVRKRWRTEEEGLNNSLPYTFNQISRET